MNDRLPLSTEFQIRNGCTSFLCIIYKYVCIGAAGRYTLPLLDHSLSFSIIQPNNWFSPLSDISVYVILFRMKCTPLDFASDRNLHIHNLNYSALVLTDISYTVQHPIKNRIIPVNKWRLTSRVRRGVCDFLERF